MTTAILVCGGLIVLLVAAIVSIGIYKSDVDEMIAAIDRVAEEKNRDE
mgnify:CR=1 FL=1